MIFVLRLHRLILCDSPAAYHKNIFMSSFSVSKNLHAVIKMQPHFDEAKCACRASRRLHLDKGRAKLTLSAFPCGKVALRAIRFLSDTTCGLKSATLYIIYLSNIFIIINRFTFLTVCFFNKISMSYLPTNH